MATDRARIAIVGRPNVGKSTLFNRLLGKRRALTLDVAGVTRDRHYADSELFDRPVTYIDTGGFVPGDEADKLSKLVRMQAQAAVEECHVVLFVVDGQEGLNSADDLVARDLRKSGRPVVLVVNKSDNPKKDDELGAAFYALGLGEPMTLSAEHALGIETLKERVAKELPPEKEDRPEGDVEGPANRKPMRLAIVGRPNVGKSTLVNAILRREQVIVSDVAGTTRDPIDTELTWQDKPLVLTDTAGIRRKATISQKVEQFSVLQALKVLDDCDVAALVLDATENAVDQDARIAGLTEERGAPLILVVNKWDLKKGQVKEEAFRDELRYRLKWASYAPIVFVSAKEGLRVDKVLELAFALREQSEFRAGTPQLNRVLQHVTQEHPMPTVGGRTLKLYYAAQVAAAPPTFVFTCNVPTGIPDRYLRYLSNYLRKVFSLSLPIRLLFKARPGERRRTDRVGTYKARKKSARRR
jgi:GTP-binding protein